MPGPRPSRTNRLSNSDREALHLADDLRRHIREWLTRRGVHAQPLVTPFVDPVGQPSVLIRLNSYLARAMVLSFIDVTTAHPPGRDSGSFSTDR